jgi:3'-phosphoadenosine 5'-phosphosulfate (PAPS) 3'-phosphatase
MAEKALLSEITRIAVEAGREIMIVYESAHDVDVEEKADGSPLTAADRNAHDLICDRLDALTPEIPLVSEESMGLDTDERLAWACLWLIDPLDGTKEFIQRNGEFTVNIALIEQGQPQARPRQPLVGVQSHRFFRYQWNFRGQRVKSITDEVMSIPIGSGQRRPVCLFLYIYIVRRFIHDHNFTSRFDSNSSNLAKQRLLSHLR